jgi:hypothetical protein
MYGAFKASVVFSTVLIMRAAASRTCIAMKNRYVPVGQTIAFRGLPACAAGAGFSTVPSGEAARIRRAAQ